MADAYNYGSTSQQQKNQGTTSKYNEILEQYKNDPNADSSDLEEGDMYAKNLAAYNPRFNYQNPGSAEYGGAGGVDMYKQLGREGMANNDAAQAATQRGLNAAYAGMRGQGGGQSVENAVLSGREAATRGQQMDALSLQRAAAMGQAPSEAAYQTRLGMQDAMSAFVGGQGGARGLGAMAGQQGAGSAAGGVAAGNIAAAGGNARSNEIYQELGQYGKTAGQVRGQDLTRLGVSNQNAQFNAGLGNEWALGNAQLAAGYGRLGNAQAGMDQQWFAESMKPADIQFQLDQEAAGWEAGAEMDRIAAKVARDDEQKQATASMVGGIAQAGLTAVGSLAGPAGAALGGMAGSAVQAATRKYY